MFSRLLLIMGAALTVNTVANAQSSRIPKVICISETGKVTLKRKCNPSTFSLFSAASYESPDEELSTRITSNSSAISTLESGQSTLSSSLNSTGNDLSTLTSRVSDLESELSDVSNNLTSLTTTVSGHTTTLSGHTTDIGTNSSAIATNTSAIAKLKPARIYQVASSGSEYSSIQSAMAAIQSDGVSPAIIHVAPGTFTITETLTVLPEIMIVGSGIGITTLSSDVSSGPSIELSNGSGLAAMTIQLSGASSTYGIDLDNVTIAAFHDLSIVCSDVGDSCVHLMHSFATFKNSTISSSVSTSGTVLEVEGPSVLTLDNVVVDGLATDSMVSLLASDNSFVTLENSSVVISTQDVGATGIQWQSTGELTLFNSTIFANSTGTNSQIALTVNAAANVRLMGTKLDCEVAESNFGCLFVTSGATVEVLNSRIESSDGASRTIYSTGGSAVKVVNSLLMEGDTGTSGGGTVTCAGVTDETYTFSAAVCP